MPALIRFSQAWICVGTGAILDQFVDVQFMVTDTFLKEYSIPQKLLYQYGCVKLVMQTYSVGWCLMESGAVAAGLSFNGYDEKGKARHDRVQCAVLWNLETSYRIKDFLTNWNISTHQWLKNYIFLRMLPNKGKGNTSRYAVAAFTTFFVSAVWHGFYPGFLMFFIYAGFLDLLAKMASPLLYPLFQGWCPWPVQYVMLFVWCYMNCGYASSAFFLLSFEKFHKVFSSMYYILHIQLIVPIVLISIFNSLKPK